MRPFLSQLASIQSGYQPPGRAAPTDAGTHLLLQASGVLATGKVIWPGPGQRMAPARRAELYELHPGDVLLLVKGQRLTAGLVEGVPPHPTIAGPQFLILRPNPELLLPAFLAWFLNHPSTQAKLAREIQGTAISFLPREAVEKLPIPAASLEQQSQIIRVQAAAATLQNLHAEWGRAQTLLADHACARILDSQP